VFSVSTAGKGWFTVLKVTEVTPLFPQAIFMALYYPTSFLVFIIYQFRSEGITHFPCISNCQQTCLKLPASTVVHDFIQKLYSDHLIPCSKALLEKLTVGQPVKKKLSNFYGTRRFITMFERACLLAQIDADHTLTSVLSYNEPQCYLVVYTCYLHASFHFLLGFFLPG
jgi:hypothetical protein